MSRFRDVECVTCGAWAPIGLPRETVARMQREARLEGAARRTMSTGATAIIYPADVVNAKNRIQAKMASTLADAKACVALSPADTASFQGFYDAWRKFFCDNDSGVCEVPPSGATLGIFGLGSQMDDCETWEAQLYTWQQKIAAICTMSEPVVAPPTPTAEKPGPFTMSTGTVVAAAAVGLGLLGLAIASRGK